MHLPFTCPGAFHKERYHWEAAIAQVRDIALERGRRGIWAQRTRADLKGIMLSLGGGEGWRQGRVSFDALGIWGLA